eukprot:TRINITY_DN4882_c1_g1_i2.p1 TRINITY_DN4882_c1_g1~~TRINITY_DN4882_c1_g1_i2.p1  ORF type:complete len:807 (+),score=173.52 TRINITY_DN4882_c1_g1_i2:48-2423(+)
MDDFEVVRVGGPPPEKRTRDYDEDEDEDDDEEDEEDEETEESEQSPAQQVVNPLAQIGGWGSATVKKVIKKQKVDSSQAAEVGCSAIGSVLEQTKLATLEKEAADDKYTASRHLAIIEMLEPRKENEEIFKKLRQVRLDLATYCTLSPEQWMNWIDEEQNRGTDSTTVYDLLKKASAAYTYVPFLLEKCEVYHDILLEANDDKENITEDDDRQRITKICQAFEEAISTAKYDFKRSSTLWTAYRSFYENEAEEDGALTQNQVNENVLSLFARQLAIPHFEVEKTISQANQFIENTNQSNYSEVISKIKRLSAMCKTLSADAERLNCERSLTDATKQKNANTEAFRKTNEKLWLDYISKELKRDNGLWVRSLYERAVCAIPWSSILWRRMISYLSESGARSAAHAAAKKAVRSIPKNHNLWIQRLRAVEKCKDATFNDATICVNEASQIAFSHPYDITAIVSEYFSMVRRCSPVTANTPQFTDLYKVIAQKGLPEELGNLAAIHNLCLSGSQDSVPADNIKKAFESALKFHSSSSAVWTQYAQAMSTLSDTSAIVTSIYERAARAVDQDEMPFIVHSWMQFERCFGTAAGIDKVRDRYTRVISDIKAGGLNLSAPQAGASGRGKRLREEEKLSKEIFWKHHIEDLGLKEPTGPPELTLFFWNVSFAVTEEDITKFLTSKGIDVVTVRLIKKKFGKSKGIAYVDVPTEDMVQKTLGLDKSKLDGREIRITKADASRTAKLSEDTEAKKLQQRRQKGGQGLKNLITPKPVAKQSSTPGGKLSSNADFRKFLLSK